MYDNQVITNNHVSTIAMLALYLVAFIVIAYFALSAIRRVTKAHGDEDSSHLIGLHDEEPDDVSLSEALQPRSLADYALFLSFAVAAACSVVGTVSTVADIASHGITKKHINEKIAVRNIEEKYNLTAVELVSNNAATNENQTTLKTDSPEFVGVYNDNTVVHFVAAFKENSGEPSIAVIPPSDGITATQIEKATSRNSPNESKSDRSDIVALR